MKPHRSKEAKAMVERKKPGHVGSIAHVDHGKTALTATVLRLLGDQRVGVSVPAQDAFIIPRPRHPRQQARRRTVSARIGGFAPGSYICRCYKCTQHCEEIATAIRSLVHEF